MIQATHKHSLNIGNYCLVGADVPLAMCIPGDQVFIAKGASVFHDTHIKEGAKVRINGVVHAKTVIPKYKTVSTS